MTTHKPEYTDVVHEISQMLFQALWEPDLDKKVSELDSIVNKLLRKIGFLVCHCFYELASLYEKVRATGLTVHRCKGVKYLSLSCDCNSLLSCGIKFKQRGASSQRPVED